MLVQLKKEESTDERLDRIEEELKEIKELIIDLRRELIK